MTQVMTSHPAAASKRRRTAFTLTELMVAIALVVLLMVGVQTVFKSAVSTVSAGQALNDLTRLERGIVATVQRDSRRMLPVASQPHLIIASHRISDVPLRRQDKDTPSALADHRVDTFAFFAGSYDDPFRRMTGDGTTNALVSEGMSTEAWVWYGHLRLPSKAASGYSGPHDDEAALPDQPDKNNPNNFYAGQWALGRAAMLLSTGLGGAIYVDPRPQTDPNYDWLSPLSSVSSGGGELLVNSRYDVASSTVGVYGARVQQAATKHPSDWWMGLMYRFAGDPWPERKPDMADAAARMVPVIAQGCTDFAVEFAGDFDGDGDIDYTTDSGSRVIKWYGLGSPVGAGTFERLTSADSYICVWGPDTAGGPYPSLVRLTVTLVDPSGRLESPRTFTHVIRVTGSQLGN